MPSGGRLFNSFGDEDEEQQSGHEYEDDTVASFDEELAQAEEQLDEEMDEAEQRINLAGYYRQLAKGGIFKDGSREAKMVDVEVRQFARERMAVLLNLPSAPKPQAEMPFNENQTTILKDWADHLIAKRSGIANPVVQSPSPPEAPKPVVKQPVKPAITPLAPPVGAQPSAPPRKQSKPKAPATQTAKVPSARPKSKVDYDRIADLTPFEENGKLYKFVTNPETGKRVKLKIGTEQQVQAPHRLPMPTAHQMASISAAQAGTDLETSSAAKSIRIQEAAALSILKQ